MTDCCFQLLKNQASKDNSSKHSKAFLDWFVSVAGHEISPLSFVYA